jgi:hypothetical protein
VEALAEVARERAKRPTVETGPVNKEGWRAITPEIV